jgi:hypothetical protein
MSLGYFRMVQLYSGAAGWRPAFLMSRGFIHTRFACPAQHFVDLVGMHLFLDDEIARVVFQQY